MPQSRIAFYPCCAVDIEEPLRLLCGMVDEIVFCDNKPSIHRKWQRLQKGLDENITPKVSFDKRDVHDAITQIPRIDVLFYRKDSGGGEGGSGVYILSPKLLPKILDKFPQEGGCIITDGSNSRGSLFRKMIRPTGYYNVDWGWHMQPSVVQPYYNEHGLYRIDVLPIIERSA